MGAHGCFSWDIKGLGRLSTAVSICGNAGPAPLREHARAEAEFWLVHEVTDDCRLNARNRESAIITKSASSLVFTEASIESSPEDAFMLGQHQCVCEEWETMEVCVAWHGNECVKYKTVTKCVSWHCAHDH
jgi:hypothetical protein